MVEKRDSFQRLKTKAEVCLFVCFFKAPNMRHLFESRKKIKMVELKKKMRSECQPERSKERIGAGGNQENFLGLTKMYFCTRWKVLAESTQILNDKKAH